MAQQQEDLFSLVERWVTIRRTSWGRLMRDAGLAESVGTDIRRGARPRPETVRKLALAMGISYEEVLRAASYPEEDIQHLISQESETPLSRRELELLANYRVLDDANQDLVERLIERLIQHQ